MFPKYFFKNAPPFKGRAYTHLGGPELLINLISRKNIFRPLHQSPRNLIIPDKIACFRKHTSKDLSARTPSYTPLPSPDVTSLINPHIRKRKYIQRIPSRSLPLFHGCPYGCKWLIISPPNNSSAIPAEPRNHPKAAHRFQLPWRIPWNSSTVKKKVNRPGRAKSYRWRIEGRFIYRGFLTVPAFQLLCAVEQRFLARTRARSAGGRQERGRWEMGKEGGGRGRQRRKSKKKKREENRRDRILLFGRGHAWFEVSPSRGALEHGWKGEEGGDGGEEGEKEEENKKKIYSFVSAHCLPRFMIVGSVTDEISMPMEARPIFHIEIPLWYIQPGRVTYFSVLTSKWTSLVYHIYSTRPIPRNRCRERERERETICLKSRSAPFPRYICYINSTVCPVLSGIFNCSRAFFFPSTFFFSIFHICAFKGPMVFIEDWRRWTGHFLIKFLFC